MGDRYQLHYPGLRELGHGHQDVAAAWDKLYGVGGALERALAAPDAFF